MSRYRDPSVSKESSVKCLEHKWELVEGPSQPFLYRFTALVHRRRIFSSVGNEYKLYPIPLVVLQSAATQRRGICGSDSLLVGCLYRSPTGDLSTSVSSLCNLFTKLDNYSHLLVCGDFNFKEVTWSDLSGSTTNSHIVPFLDSVDDLFLFQHVNKPTRIRGRVILQAYSI